MICSGGAVGATVASFDLVTPSTVEEAIASLRVDRGASSAVIAGGTDLLLDIDDGRSSPTRVISLRRLPWRTLDWVNGALTIGSTLPLRTLEDDPEVRTRLPGLWQAVHAVGSVALRHRATIGGNLGRSAPASDLVPILLALDAEVDLVGVGGSRRLSVDRFVRASRRTALEPGELIRSVRIPESRPSSYLWQRVRPANDISQVAVAVSFSPAGRAWTVAVGGVPPCSRTWRPCSGAGRRPRPPSAPHATGPPAPSPSWATDGPPRSTVAVSPGRSSSARSGPRECRGRHDPPLARAPCQRPEVGPRRGTRRRASARHASVAARTQRNEGGLPHRRLRGLHRTRRWSEHPFLPDPDPRSGRDGRHDDRRNRGGRGTSARQRRVREGGRAPMRLLHAGVRGRAGRTSQRARTVRAPRRTGRRASREPLPLYRVRRDRAGRGGGSRGTAMSTSVRPDSVVKLAGAAVYGTDLDVPGMMWGALVPAPVAHGRVTSLDLGPARALPGVTAIGPDDLAALLPTGSGDPDRPLFASGEIAYRNQPLAAVAAPTRRAA